MLHFTQVTMILLKVLTSLTIKNEYITQICFWFHWFYWNTLDTDIQSRSYSYHCIIFYSVKQLFIFGLPHSMMNCHCRHQDHLSCPGKAHLITVREAQDGQRLRYELGTYLSFFHAVLHSHKHTLFFVSQAVWYTWDKNSPAVLFQSTANISNKSWPQNYKVIWFLSVLLFSIQMFLWWKLYTSHILVLSFIYILSNQCLWEDKLVFVSLLCLKVQRAEILPNITLFNLNWGFYCRQPKWHCYRYWLSWVFIKILFELKLWTGCQHFNTKYPANLSYTAHSNVINY